MKHHQYLSLATIISLAEILLVPHKSYAADVDVIKSSVSDIGRVELYGEGTPHIVLLSELHGYPEMQLNELLVVARLERSAPIKNIVLEGMLQEDTSALMKPGLSDTAGVELVRNGEISAAEFMNLSRRIPLIWGEDHASHDAKPGDSLGESCGVLADYAANVLQTRGGKEGAETANQVKELNEQQEATAKALPNLSLCKQIGEFHDSDFKTTTIERQIAQRIPELKDVARMVCSRSGLVENQVDDVIGAIDQAKAFLISTSTAEDTGPLDDLKKYLLARDRASYIIAANIARATTKDGWTFAIIGDAHGKRIVDELVKAKNPVAWVRFNSFSRLVSKTAVPGGEWYGLPAERGILSDQLVDDFGSAESRKEWSKLGRIAKCDFSQHRFKPQTSSAFTQSRVDFSYLAESITEAIFGGQGGGGVLVGVLWLRMRMVPIQSRCLR